MGGAEGPLRGGAHRPRQRLPSLALDGGLEPWEGPGEPVSSVPTRAPPPAHARSLPRPRQLAQGPSGKLDLKADNF